MTTYHNDPTLKAQLVSAARHHRDADMLLVGTWEQGSGERFRGCSLACLIHSLNGLPNVETPAEFNDFAGAAEATGWPEWLHRIQEGVFEGLSNTHASAPADWHVALVEAVSVGEDLSRLKYALQAWMLADDGETGQVVFDRAQFPEVAAAVERMRTLNLRASEGDDPTAGEWSASASAAEAARSASWSASWSAARSAASAESAESAESAAWAGIAAKTLALIGGAL